VTAAGEGKEKEKDVDVEGKEEGGEEEEEEVDEDDSGFHLNGFVTMRLAVADEAANGTAGGKYPGVVGANVQAGGEVMPTVQDCPHDEDPVKASDGSGKEEARAATATWGWSQPAHQAEYDAL